MREPTIAANVASALIELAVSKGARRVDLGARSRIDLPTLGDRDNRIPLATYVALMRAGQELCNDPALALHFGEAVDVSEISIAGLIGAAAPSLSDGFALLNRYAPLAGDVAGSHQRFELRRERGEVWLIDTRENANDFPELTESTFARIVCSARRAFGDKPFVTAVHVTHAAPSYRTEYDRIFRVPIVFESDRNALLTDEAWLAYQPSGASRHLSAILNTHADTLLEQLELSTSVRGRVETLLIPALRTGEATIDAIASELGLSRQTLFRKLKVEGVTFATVLDELRHRLALHYLQTQRLSVKQTAHLVGFSDSTSFSRAFKRWTGSSPRVRRTSA
jgi:AraC-like DNA-binding protein